MRAAPQRAKWIWDIVPVLLLPVAVLSAITMPVNENDMFIHILMGRDILMEQRLTGNPDWTYGPYDADWVTFVHWPSQVLMALGFDAFGFGFFAVLHVAMIACFVLALYLAIRQIDFRGGADKLWQSRVGAAAILFSVIVLTPSMGPRANTVGAIFAVIVGVWFSRVLFTGSFGKCWWLVPLVVWIWVLLHGNALFAAPILGLGLALWWITQKQPFTKENLKRAAKSSAPVVAAALVPVLTPLGFLVWERSLNIQNSYAGWIHEWSPLPLLSLEGVSSALLLLAGVALCILSLRRGVSKRQVAAALVALAFIGFALFYQQRNYLIFMPILIVLLAMLFLKTRSEAKAQSWERLDDIALLKNLSMMTLVIAYCVSALFLAAGAGLRSEVDDEKFPIEIAEELVNEYPQGGRKVFAPFSVAAEVPFYAPGNAVAFDARLDRYPIEIMIEASDSIYYGRPDWQNWLDKRFPGTTDLLLPNRSPLAADALEGGWKPVLETTEWILLSRPAPDAK